MPHIFSVEIHDFLSQKILHARKEREIAELADDQQSCQYYKGQLLELSRLRQYLVDHIDLKTQNYF